MAFRQATASDLEDLTEIVISCSDDDPCYLYRFPEKGRFPDLFREHCRRKCREYLDSSTVVVYEVSNPPKKVVAFSVWEQPKQRRPAAHRSQTWPRWDTQPSSGAGRQDRKADEPGREQQKPVQCNNKNHDDDSDAAAHPNQPVQTPSQTKGFAREDRSRAFRDASQTAKADFFDRQYGAGGYMFLKILLCHPGYRRRGAGTTLVKWGMSVAHVQGVHTALFSSPMGVNLYHKLDFQQVGRFEVKVEGDDDKLDIPAMVFRAPSPDRSRRGSRCADEVTPNALRKCLTNNPMVSQKV